MIRAWLAELFEGSMAVVVDLGSEQARDVVRHRPYLGLLHGAIGFLLWVIGGLSIVVVHPVVGIPVMVVAFGWTLFGFLVHVKIMIGRRRRHR